MIIEINDNFFPNDLYLELNEYSKELLHSPQIRMGLLSNFCWPQNIVKDSSTVLIGGFSNKSFEINSIKIIEEKIGREPTCCMYYYWTPMSHIPWHGDDIYSCAMTIFLNETWDKDNGGLFLYEKDDANDIRCIVPKANRAIIQKNVNHSVTCLTKNSPVRRTMQIFWEK